MKKDIEALIEKLGWKKERHNMWGKGVVICSFEMVIWMELSERVKYNE
jgi:hypothetical protein